MPAEINPDSDGWVCPDHPDYHPLGLTAAHALNSMAKHNREFHAEPVFNLTAAALSVVSLIMEGTDMSSAPGVLVWRALTGTTGQEALDLAVKYSGSHPPVLLSAPPF